MNTEIRDQMSEVRLPRIGRESRSGLSEKQLGHTAYVAAWRRVTRYARGLTAKGKPRVNARHSDIRA